MEYLAKTLGIDIYLENWNKDASLPYYLSDRYEFRKADFQGVDCIVMTPKGELDTLTAIKKHIDIVNAIEPVPALLELNSISSWRRKSLIGARIPFIVTGSQIYLPFLGVVLTEQFTENDVVKETLMPSSQLLFFSYLIQGEREMYSNGFAKRLGFSDMQISRSVKQLTTLGLMNMKKDGVRIVISGAKPHNSLYELAKPHLLDPVRKRIYVDYEEVPGGLLLSGLSALSKVSMLNSPETNTYAFYGKLSDLRGTNKLIDQSTQVEVEVWQYNPLLLSSNHETVDTLSLCTSMRNLDDERIDKAIDELLAQIWENEE